MQLCVMIASRGRPSSLDALSRLLSQQTRLPDHVVYSVTSISDLPADFRPGGSYQVVTGEAGLCAQRNRAIEQNVTRPDLVIFFDDDYVPAVNWLELAEQFSDLHPSVVGFMGQTLLDGARGDVVDYEIAEKSLASASRTPHPPQGFEPDKCLYGCNMAYRTDLVGDMRFDENLPLYGWLEDRDFSTRASRRGPVGRVLELRGVHLGVASARTPGLRLGFSQVVNPLYLSRTRAISRLDGLELMMRALLKNALRSSKPEALIDRRGRLVGNLRGLLHLLSGRCDPRAAKAL